MYSYTTQVDLIIKMHVDISPTLKITMLLKFVRFEKKKVSLLVEVSKIHCFPRSLWLALINI